MVLVVEKLRGQICNNWQYLRGQACTAWYLVANHLRGRVNHFRHTWLHKGWWDDDSRPFLAIGRGFLRAENWFQLWFSLNFENWKLTSVWGLLIWLGWPKDPLYNYSLQITVSKMFRWQLWLLVFSPVAPLVALQLGPSLKELTWVLARWMIFRNSWKGE